MEEIISYLEKIPSSEFYKTLGILIYSTCSGFVPNNNDLSLAAAAFIAQVKQLSPHSTALFCFSIWALGESTTFSIGHFLGARLLKTKLVQKKIDLKRQEMLTKMINENLWSLIFTIRISPVLRSWTILGIGALGLKPIHFFTKHIPLLFVHSMILFHSFYYLGPLLKSFFSEYSVIVMIVIIMIWFSLMFFVGRKFYQKLEAA